MGKKGGLYAKLKNYKKELTGVINTYRLLSPGSLISLAALLAPVLTSTSDANIHQVIHKIFPSSEVINHILKFAQRLEEFSFSSAEEPLPGKVLSQRNVGACSPVIIVPGITSISLELWRGPDGAESHFRKKIWGSFDMLKHLFNDKESWHRHMKLCDDTGVDPKNIKVRAAQGLSSADFILPGYWVWGKIIQNLAEIGYDYTNLHMASFDWRLGMEELEERDHYFTRLKSEVELLRKTNNNKVVLMSHSLGSLVCFYFINWIQYTEGSQWIDRNIDSLINIAAPLLGVPKAISGLISGEAKDTAQLGIIEGAIMEYFIGKEERRDIFRTWGSMRTLIPKGGNKFWGDENGNLDGCHSNALINFTFNDSKYYADTIMDLLKGLLPENIYKRIIEKSNYGWVLEDPSDKRCWINPLLCVLPNAPNLKIFSFYGIGKLTEKAYVYTETYEDDAKVWSVLDLFKRKDVKRRKVLEIAKNIAEPSKNLQNGIYMVDGDGTVPLISAGYMGRKGWKRTDLNPYGVRVIVREYKHDPVHVIKDMRGGPRTSDHVDILGNYDMTMDILKIVSKDEEVDDLIISNIDELCDRIDDAAE
jgi:phospholipid:diacylglycerol acyltransferase